VSEYEDESYKYPTSLPEMRG